MNTPKPCLLMILDGWGINPDTFGNAFRLADTPILDGLKERYPNTRLLCSGDDVGLPPGIMGNSEVGHLNLGAGRVVFQDLLRIDQAIQDGAFFKNDVFGSVLSKIKQNKSSLHLMGLVSDGGVHSQLNHLFALLDMAKKMGVDKVFVHAILDGRDTPPDGGIDYLQMLEHHMEENKSGQIASICGRFFAMDRDKRWDRVEKAYRLFVLGKGVKETDPVTAVKKSYEQGDTDEFVKPVVIVNANGKPRATVKDKDGIIFFNFRADRAREITSALIDPDFEFFKRDIFPDICEFVCMALYDEKYTLPIAFPATHLEEILGEVVSRNGLKQLRIAETEKYAHVTYFFNGGEEKPFPNEDRCLIQSPRDIPTYDYKPEMSAFQVTDEVIKRINSGEYDFIVLNFANMDMVGHTGVLKAAIKACETVDQCVGKIIKLLMKQGGTALITADHGNSEKMLDENGHVHTAHTLNPVPLILVDDNRKKERLKTGRLADIAPTILHLLGIDKPEQMTGNSLIDR